MNDLLSTLKKFFPARCHGHIFLAGGSVRDCLLGKASKDIDLAAALPDALLRQCGFSLVTGKTTAPIWFHFETTLGKIEITQLAAVSGLHEDLRRRDFTINAMAMGFSGELLDPLHGRDDLHAGCLRACSDDIFRDDPLRIFRALRFEADGWRMTPSTESLIRRDDWSAQLQVIPVERFSRELLKALAAREPERFLLRMRDFEVGREWLPELFRMAEIPAGPLQHHPEGDLLTHSVQVLQRAAVLSADPLTRFCAFFHDFGKLATDPTLYPQHHGHEETGFSLAIAFCNRLALPAAYRKALAWTSRLHAQLNRWDELRDPTKVRTAQQAAKAGITDILPVVALADKAGGITPDGWQQALAVAAMTTTELGIDATVLAAVPAADRPSLIMQKRVEKLRGV